MYTDHNIGMVLDTLEASGVKEETVVAIMGVSNLSRRLSAPSQPAHRLSVQDHGYNLGELNLWCKMTVSVGLLSDTSPPHFAFAAGV